MKRNNRVVIVDNFDSFTYNLVQLLGAIGVEVIVLRNNVALDAIAKLEPTHLVISPGPGAPPHDTGITCPAIEHFAGKIPILGVCLGHQAIGHVFGAKVVRAPGLMHGKSSRIRFNWPHRLFDGIELEGRGDPVFEAGRYHSLVINEESTTGTDLEIIARSEDDHQVMAVQHRVHPIYGVQFHPESLLTAKPMTDPYAFSSPGRTILANFLALS